MSKSRFVGAFWSRYLRSRLGYAQKTGKSPYELLVLAAKEDGLVKPHDMKARRFVIENEVKFRELAKKVQPERKQKQVGINPNDNAFLSSYEWRRIRMEVLKKYGARCQCCGATAKDGVVINVDHIKPRRLFPQLALDINNLQVLCEVCNHGKGNWDMTDWRVELRDVSFVVK